MQLTAGLMRPVAPLRRFSASLRSAQCHSDSAIKTLDQLNVQQEGDWIVIETHARSFLHHPVQSMAGCLAPLHALYFEAADDPEQQE